MALAFCIVATILKGSPRVFKFVLSWARPREPPCLGVGDKSPYA